MLKLIKELLFGKPAEETKPEVKAVPETGTVPVITPLIMPMAESKDSQPVEAKKSTKKKATVKKDPSVKKPRGRKPKATA